MKFGGELYEELKKYAASDYCAFHMPGHKRQLGGFADPFCIDISEIAGFDDLHHPEADGVLTRAQERAARLLGAEETHFLVNGSTAGILSAVSGCTSRGGKILMARGCHRSAYHAVELMGLAADYLYPAQAGAAWLNGAVLPETVEAALAAARRARADGRIQAVLITSPTYDGVCSDVRAIAGICHRYGLPLIVDQAHGAHFPFSNYFPEDAVRAGADVVIHSVHKTLPSLTQTALLHIQGKLADRERIRHYLSVYQSSSPSYVLMASIDACVDLLEREGRQLFAAYTARLEQFRESCRDLRVLALEGGRDGRIGAAEFDRSKLLITAARAGVTGAELAQLLLERFRIQPEMTMPDSVCCLSSVADTEEMFARLGQALHALDAELAGRAAVAGQAPAWQCGLAGAADPAQPEEDQSPLQTLPRLEAVYRIADAAGCEAEACRLEACAGRIAADYLYLYPPGVPLAAPGERLTEEIVAQLQLWRKAGFTVHGLLPGGGAEGSESPQQEAALLVLQESSREGKR